MKISIIVPVYNASEYIHKLEESVINQTYEDYELIFVDDGSTDNSFEIIKKYSEQSNRIKAFTKKNTGPGYTRKFGFEKSTGDLVFFIDSDDWITDNEVLYKINQIFNENNIDILFFNREDIVGNKSNILLGFEKVSAGYHKIEEGIKDYIRPGLGAKIFKSKILSSEMFIEANVYEDLYTTYMYLDKCNNFYYTNQVFYTIYHAAASDSLSAKTFDTFERYKKTIDIVLSLYGKLNNDLLKESLRLRMPSLFMRYNFQYKKLADENLKKKIYKIVKILKNNNVKYKPEYKLEKFQYLKFFLKKIYYITSLTAFCIKNNYKRNR